MPVKKSASSQLHASLLWEIVSVGQFYAGHASVAASQLLFLMHNPCYPSCVMVVHVCTFVHLLYRAVLEGQMYPRPQVTKACIVMVTTSQKVVIEESSEPA